jgi:arabinan endo-1,5-alpha-L-arabinosidase
LSLLLCALLLCECNTFAGEQLPETSPGLTATTSPDSSSDTTGGSPPPDNRTDDDSTATYQNPVVTPVAADPTIIRAPDGTYYLYATQDAWADGDGWHYLPIFKSDNLVDWTFVHDALDGLPTWGGDDGYLWAPDVSRHEDTYYLYFSRIRPGEGPCIGLATADDPEGPWREIGRPVFCSGDVGVPNSIDPFVWYEDGTRTMIWGSFRGIYAVELNGNGTAPAGSKVQLADDRFEGAYVEKHGGSYYLFVSAGTCCEGANSTYEVQVGRSDSLTGPYVDKEGDDLRNGGGTRILDGTRTWVGPGHNSIATDDAGHDWMVYHAIPRDDPRLSNGINRRPTLIDRIRWEDGWPVINGGEGPTTTEQPTPEIETTGTGIEKPPEPR